MSSLSIIVSHHIHVVLICTKCHNIIHLHDYYHDYSVILMIIFSHYQQSQELAMVGSQFMMDLNRYSFLALLHSMTLLIGFSFLIFPIRFPVIFNRYLYQDSLDFFYFNKKYIFWLSSVCPPSFFASYSSQFYYGFLFRGVK